MKWLQLALGLISLAQFFIRQHQKSRDIAEGERRAIARATAGILEEAGIARQIEAETAGMTPEQVLRDLEGRGELRD